MGRRGTKSRPKEVLDLIGSDQQYGRRDEPDSPDGDPKPPGWLSKAGLVQWSIMVERMRGMQFLSPIWRESLAQFCEAWAEYELLVLRCQHEDYVVTSPKGAVYLNPIFGAKNKAWERVLKMGREFGYTPASKASVKLEKKPQKNNKNRFFASSN